MLVLSSNPVRLRALESALLRPKLFPGAPLQEWAARQLEEMNTEAADQVLAAYVTQPESAVDAWSAGDALILRAAIRDRSIGKHGWTPDRLRRPGEPLRQ